MEGFESLSFLKWIYKHIKPLLVIQVIALALSVVFSSQYFMPKEYKSYTVIYPSNMTDYSHESPSEQMIEFLNSVDIKNKVIENFNLRSHYGLPQDGKTYYNKIYSEYDHNVIIEPTEYGAVEIIVYDINPDTAYTMVNGILDILNKKINEVQKEKSAEVADMWKSQLAVKQHKIDSMVNLSKQMSEQYGLLDYPNQSKEVAKAYYQALTAGKGSKQYDEVAQQMKNMEDHGTEFRQVNWQIETAVTDYNLMEAKYEDAMKDANRHFTFWNLVSAPFRPDSYTYPLRTLIILASCFAAFVFSIVVIRSAEKIRQ